MKDNEKEIICLCMFYALNWFRELVNAFSAQSKDDASFTKLVKRIEHIIQLEDQLDRCLGGIPQITLPAYNNSGSHTITLKESTNKKKSVITLHE
jgi:Fanconi anemia group D2 protein